jgi:hypothetical protein
MESLGHSSISVTMDTCAHALTELQREAAERMNQSLDG